MTREISARIEEKPEEEINPSSENQERSWEAKKAHYLGVATAAPADAKQEVSSGSDHTKVKLGDESSSKPSEGDSSELDSDSIREMFPESWKYVEEMQKDSSLIEKVRNLRNDDNFKNIIKLLDSEDSATTVTKLQDFTSLLKRDSNLKATIAMAVVGPVILLVTFAYCCYKLNRTSRNRDITPRSNINVDNQQPPIELQDGLSNPPPPAYESPRHSVDTSFSE